MRKMALLDKYEEWGIGVRSSNLSAWPRLLRGTAKGKLTPSCIVKCACQPKQLAWGLEVRNAKGSSSLIERAQSDQASGAAQRAVTTDAKMQQDIPWILIDLLWPILDPQDLERNGSFTFRGT